MSFRRTLLTFRSSSSSSSSRRSESGVDVDDQGRRIRRRSRGETESRSTDSWDDFEPALEPRRSLDGASGGWDDFDPLAETSSFSSKPRQSPQRNRSREDRPPRKRRSFVGREKSAEDLKINLKALEGAGFVHLYGLASVLNALQANRRDFTRPEDLIDLEDLPPEDLEHESRQRQRKPEAQFTPWLFVQERNTKATSSRTSDKTVAAEQVEQLANERGIPIAYVDKGVLNTLSGNRPHQGYVLRCGKLSFDTLTRIPHPVKDDPEAPNLWLVLDEVVDPQNLGALLRSAYFLGGTSVGVLVCAKNSAPPSPIVSAASAGALELTHVYSTSNLPRTLQQAREDGFYILGASSSVPRDADASLYELQQLGHPETITTSRPTLLVLGSEGHGLRTLVAKACTDFVRIPSGVGASDDDAVVGGVDSLNVSVTGGILLWYLLRASTGKSNDE